MQLGTFELIILIFIFIGLQAYWIVPIIKKNNHLTKKGKDLLERETGVRDIKMVDLRSDREFYLQQLGKVFSQKSLKGLSIKELDELLDYTLATGGI